MPPFAQLTGRQLTGAVMGSTTYSFTHNDEGIRTSKTKNGVKTSYYYNGTQLIAEETSGNVTVYLYDASGSPLGFKYHASSYAVDVWDSYWYEKNLQGDVVAVYNNSGTLLITYSYNAWGYATLMGYNGGYSTQAYKNPFRYRGYYYDTDLGLYYLGTRYYDSWIGRFISPDSVDVINASPYALTDKNLYAYCDNNPVTRVDHGGEWWVFANAIVGAIVGFVSKVIDNLSNDTQWSAGTVGSTFGGGVSGAVMASTKNTVAANYIGAGAESFANEVASYIPKVSEFNGETSTKTLNRANVANSLSTVTKDMLVNGSVNLATSYIAGRIIPTNNGWFTPKKFLSSFLGKYAKRAHAQTFLQGFVGVAAEDYFLK